jgi:hypothetical protein
MVRHQRRWSSSNDAGLAPVEHPEDRQGQEVGERIPLPRRSGNPRSDAAAEEKVQIDDELDVTIVRAVIDEGRRQYEDVLAVHPFP